VYSLICGEHPHARPWHFQWLDGYYLYRSLRRVLPTLSGRVLDAGCGNKPYRSWFGPVTEYVGLDIVPGPEVDVVVAPRERWPFSDAYFDVLLSSQVLEHVEDLNLTLSEMNRVVKPDGIMLLSFPFIYNEHGAPQDFHRFTAHRAIRLLPETRVIDVQRQGGIGSTISLLFLNWLEQASNLTKTGRLLKGVLLPVWIPLCLVVNLGGWLVDRVDRTAAYYNNILIILRKNVHSPPGEGRGASPDRLILSHPLTAEVE
jgi:SAM-dependent methyltransferase